MNKEPQITDTAFISFDGYELPLKTWLPAASPKAVIIALHGFNDYSAFIKDMAVYFKERQIGIYAYDQRGFGAAPHRGKWAGHRTMCRDLGTFTELVRKRHPDVPLYLLGDSMGGAVVLAAGCSESSLAAADGVILVAPAVWTRRTMPFYQRWALWLGGHLAPKMQLTPPKRLKITPSDNKKMLRNLGRDPLMLRGSRIDTLYGLTNLMDKAYEAAADFHQKALFLYGKKDEIIPARPMADVFKKRLRDQFTPSQRLLVYENGYHMLLRDLQAEVVWEDILVWLDTHDGTFPSVKEKLAIEITRDADIKDIFRTASDHPTDTAEDEITSSRPDES